jgi:hypothetical protein
LPPACGEEFIAGGARGDDLAHIGARIPADVRLEIVAVRRTEVARHRVDLARHQRMPVAIEQQNGIDLGRCVADALELVMIGALLRADAFIGNALEHLRDLQEREVHRLEHFERMLVHDLERALDALVGGLLRRAIIDERRIGEQHERQDDRPGDRQIEEP